MEYIWSLFLKKSQGRLQSKGFQIWLHRYFVSFPHTQSPSWVRVRVRVRVRLTTTHPSKGLMHYSTSTNPTMAAILRHDLYVSLLFSAQRIFATPSTWHSRQTEEHSRTAGTPLPRFEVDIHWPFMVCAPRSQLFLNDIFKIGPFLITNSLFGVAISWFISQTLTVNFKYYFSYISQIDLVINV